MDQAEVYEADMQAQEENARSEALANEQLMADREKALASALREAALMGVSLASLKTLAFESGSRLVDPVWSSYETEWRLWD